MSNLFLRPRVFWKTRKTFGARRAALAAVFAQQWPRRHDDLVTTRGIAWLNLACSFANLPRVLFSAQPGRFSRLVARRWGQRNRTLAEIYADILPEQRALSHESSPF